MRIVVVLGSFPPEMTQFDLLAESSEVVLYGSDRRSSNVTYHPQIPQVARTRTLEPIVLGGSGHLRWLYRGLSAALEADRPEIVHVVSEPWGSLALQAARWARRKDFRGLVIHGCDQLWFSGPDRRGPKRLPRIAAARFALAAAHGFAGENSGAISEARLGGLRESAVTAVVHTNPRNTTVFEPPSREERIVAREKAGLPVNGVGVCLLGKLVPEKGSLLFLEAWEHVRQHLGGIEAWGAIAGSGPLEAQLRQRTAGTRDLNVLGPLTFPNEVVNYLKGCDVFVHPPSATPEWAEQGPRVLIEAMMSGCLVVATDSGANREVLGQAGLLVPESQPTLLGQAILEAIRLRAKGPEGLGARQRAVGEFSVEATTRKLMDLWLAVSEVQSL